MDGLVNQSESSKMTKEVTNQGRSRKAISQSINQKAKYCGYTSNRCVAIWISYQSVVGIKIICDKIICDKITNSSTVPHPLKRCK